MKILIAEDDFTSREMLKTVLRTWGNDVVTATDGDEAWKMLGNGHVIDLALFAVGMSGPTVEELCRRIHGCGKTSAPYVIVAASMDEREAMFAGLGAGGDDVLFKPYNVSDLYARLRVAMRVMALENESARRGDLGTSLKEARGACHDMSQPLQIAAGTSQLLLMNMTAADQRYKNVRLIKEKVDRTVQLVRRLRETLRSVDTLTDTPAD